MRTTQVTQLHQAAALDRILINCCPTLRTKQQLRVHAGSLLSVQCNTLHGTEYKITCGVCLCVCVCTGIWVEYLENA